MRNERYRVIRELQRMAIERPQLTSIGEWEGDAANLLEDFEDFVIEAYKTHTLIVSNHGPKIWTLWNSMVYCSTIYTTIGEDIFFERVYFAILIRTNETINSWRQLLIVVIEEY